MRLEPVQPRSPTPRIVVEGVGRDYQSRAGERFTALQDVSFDVRDGEFLSVVGPSGCGKSTLLMILGGLLRATHGSVTLDGRPQIAPSTKIGYVFQNPVLLPWRTVLENVLLPIRVQHGDLADARRRALDLLGMVGLADAAEKYPFELSGGMQQRTSLVRSLIHDPEVLLMDEPFGALDAMSREQLNLDIQRIWLESRKTVVFITHSIPEAAFLGDRVLVMAKTPGRVVHIEAVSAPRPRSLDALSTDEFGAHVQTIRHQLAHQP